MLLTYAEALRMAQRIWSDVHWILPRTDRILGSALTWLVVLEDSNGPRYLMSEDGTHETETDTIVRHVEPWHEPWTLHDCPACETACPHEHDGSDAANEWCVVRFSHRIPKHYRSTK